MKATCQPPRESDMPALLPDAEKDRRQEEKWTTEDEMVGWHHRLDGGEFEQIGRASCRERV